jgi:hypothetical protein
MIRHAGELEDIFYKHAGPLGGFKNIVWNIKGAAFL